MNIPNSICGRVIDDFNCVITDIIKPMNRRKVENLLQATDHLSNYTKSHLGRYLHAVSTVNNTIVSVKFDVMGPNVKIDVFNPTFSMHTTISDYNLLAAVIPRIDALLTKDNRICWYVFTSHRDSICPGSVEWLNLGDD